MFKLNKIALVSLAFGAALAANDADATAVNLITNGSFTTTTAGTGQLGYNTDATGWTTSGYNFLFAAGSADTTGATGQYGTLKLWGPGDGSANGLPATSPDGGNFVGADGAYNVGAITQSVSSLIVGQQYYLGFYWAGAQQSGYTGATTEAWKVSLGSQTLTTGAVSIASQGFSGWMYTTLTFTATSSTETLSFLAAGTPTGQPPFALLDGVTLYAVPEPGTFALMMTGIAALGFLRFRKRSRS